MKFVSLRGLFAEDVSDVRNLFFQFSNQFRFSVLCRVKVVESLPKNIALIVEIVIFAITFCQIVGCNMPINIKLLVVLIQLTVFLTQLLILHLNLGQSCFRVNKLLLL